MINIILLATCFLLGIILRRTGRFPEGAPAVLNGFVIYVSLPSLTLLHIHKLHLDMGLLFTAFMAWALFGLGFVFFRFVGKWAGLTTGTTGALMLVGGLGNTSFVGLPMIEAFYGKEYMGIGIIADQLGSFLVLSTLGILVATVYSSGDVSPRQMARKVLLFPPFQALVLALLLKPLPYPEWLTVILQKLGDTLTPLALSSVGFQLRLSHIKGEVKNLGIGLFYKLLLGPALLALLYVFLLGGSGKVMQVTLFEAAMAPMITAGIIAIDHELNPPLVTLMIGIGIPLSFLTLTAWWWLLQGI
jgi:malate permease and related proteins